MTQKIVGSRSMLKYERTEYDHNIIKNNIIKFCDNNIILISFNITNAFKHQDVYITNILQM